MLPLLIKVSEQEFESVFSYLPPSISSLSSYSGSTEGGIGITIAGTSLGRSGAVVYFQPLPYIGVSSPLSLICLLISQSDSQIVCTVPASRGSASIRVLVAGQSSVTNIYYNYSAPTITSLSPIDAASTIGGSLLTIYGNSFDIIGTVTVGTSECVIASTSVVPIPYSHSTIYCVLPPGIGVNIDVFVTQTNTGFKSISSGFSKFGYSAPNLVSVNPGFSDTGGQV